MKMKILGAGCPKCKALAKLVEEVTSGINIDYGSVAINGSILLNIVDIIFTYLLSLNEH